MCSFIHISWLVSFPVCPLWGARMSWSYLSVVSAHGAIAAHWAAGIAVSGVGEQIILDFIIPRLHKLQDGAVAGGYRGEKKDLTELL